MYWWQASPTFWIYRSLPLEIFPYVSSGCLWLSIHLDLSEAKENFCFLVDSSVAPRPEFPSSKIMQKGTVLSYGVILMGWDPSVRGVCLKLRMVKFIILIKNVERTSQVRIDWIQAFVLTWYYFYLEKSPWYWAFSPILTIQKGPVIIGLLVVSQTWLKKHQNHNGSCRVVLCPQ